LPAVRQDPRRRLALLSTRAFPEDRAFIGALVSALDKFLDEDRPLTDAVVFLQR